MRPSRPKTSKAFSLSVTPFCAVPLWLSEGSSLRLRKRLAGRGELSLQPYDHAIRSSFRPGKLFSLNRSHEIALATAGRGGKKKAQVMKHMRHCQFCSIYEAQVASCRMCRAAFGCKAADQGKALSPYVILCYGGANGTHAAQTRASQESHVMFHHETRKLRSKISACEIGFRFASTCSRWTMQAAKAWPEFRRSLLA